MTHQMEVDHQSPQCKTTLVRYFPGALKGQEVEQLVADELLTHGLTDNNTLYADCSCPDEINHDDPCEDITSMFQKRWGEIFPLAGLAGLPFTGETGWSAFSSHCP